MEVEKLQNVVFHQFTEIQTLEKAVGKLMQERIQRQFVMHIRPSHVATTKGESSKMQSAETPAAQTDSTAQQHESTAAIPVAEITLS